MEGGASRGAKHATIDGGSADVDGFFLRRRHSTVVNRASADNKPAATAPQRAYDDPVDRRWERASGKDAALLRALG
ncbi:hypothetical protein SAMN02800691_0098 [Luteibacter sp. UNCMF366Tsu5.1]|nr:hypothetical protein SAMN02800691_0098 [Luteibacter sp. UNCMF366Tsu5.1]